MAAAPLLPATAEERLRTACERCGGSGYVVRARNYDHPRFGKAEPCVCILKEPAATRRDRLERLSNLGTLTRFTFGSLSPAGRAGDDPAFGAIVEAALAYAENPDGWLVFTGPSGAGKTHLAAAIANRRIELGAPALFMVVPDLLDHLRASYRADDDEAGFAEIFEQVRNAPMLVLDDLDAASGTPWAREKLYQVVNHRYNAQLPTVFTTATGLSALEDRLASRLGASGLSTVVGVGGNRQAGGVYAQVGGMSRPRLAEMQFSGLGTEVTSWSPVERESFRAAVTAARMYAEEPGGWLVIMGAHGCGKTHLAAAIANTSLRRGRSVFFAVVPDLLDHLRASFAPNAETGYDEIFDQVRNVELLVLDDLGAHNSSPWAEEKLFQIINYRTVSRLPTVVTTDLRPDGIQQVLPRAYARIFDPHIGQAVEILAPHYALGRTAGRTGSPPGRPRRARP